MIGDWVYRPDCYDQVKEISNNGIIGLDSLRGRIMFGELKPIPLTAEILEKNFPTIEDGVTWSNTADSDLFNIRVEYDKYVEGIFKYVHELQHALRLAGIEKTIEL